MSEKTHLALNILESHARAIVLRNDVGPNVFLYKTANFDQHSPYPPPRPIDGKVSTTDYVGEVTGRVMHHCPHINGHAPTRGNV